MSADEGLIAIPYEPSADAYSRVHQFAKLMMYIPSSGMYSCPLAMTDGAARLTGLLLLEKDIIDVNAEISALQTLAPGVPPVPQLRPLGVGVQTPLALGRAASAYRHLTTRDGDRFWTSGALPVFAHRCCFKHAPRVRQNPELTPLPLRRP